MMKRVLFLLLMVWLLVACRASERAGPAATAESLAPAVAPSGDQQAPAASDQALGPEATATMPPAATQERSAEDAAAGSDQGATAVPALEDTPQDTEPAPQDADAAAVAVEPIEVTYITPAQQEGPYYPVDKPADRDNDLLDFAGAEGEPQGQPLYFSGVIYDANGWPVPGITVEIWQTDSNGVYLHPGDPGTESRDRNFQFYGESVTGEDGVYSFRTIVPGHYEPRPRHIHVKVKQDGQELLTTQFYFADELALQGDEAAMLIAAAPAEDDGGNPILVGERDIVLSLPLVAQ